MPSCLSPSGFLRKQQQKAPSGVNYGIVTHKSVYEIFDELQFQKKAREEAEEREREKARVEREKNEKEKEKKPDDDKDDRNSTCSTQCSAGQSGVIEHWDTDNVNNANNSNPDGKSKNNNKVTNPVPQGCPHGPCCDECRIAISRLTLPFCMGCKALIQQWRPRAVGGVLG
jgi:hypothetical protein